MTEKPKPKPEMTVQPLIDLLNQFTGLVKMFPLKFLQVTPAIKERQFAMGTVPLPNDIVYDDVKSLAKWVYITIAIPRHQYLEYIKKQGEKFQGIIQKEEEEQ
ncbi:MAG: hypothetical protein ACTSP6_06045 [Promethearchaeota archaeon]